MLTARCILLSSALLLLSLASIGLAVEAGTYQQTRDGKTNVWNGTPRPGEGADWEGERDKEGYATGFGTLTWFTAKGTIYARYFGNMVRGKFEGPVNVHSNGKTGHAFFVDGGRTTGWARGPAPSRMAAPEGVELQAEVSRLRPSATASQGAQKPEVSSSTSSQGNQRSEARGQKAEVSSVTTSSSTETAKTKTSHKSLLAPGAVRAVESETHKPTEPSTNASAPRTKRTPAVAVKSSKPTEDQPQRANPSREKTETEGVASPPEPTPIPKIAVAEPTPPEAGPSVPSEEKAEVNRSPEPIVNTPETRPKPKADVSLNALAGPPSSLHTEKRADVSPAKSQTESSPSGDTHLTEEEATALADSEAHTEGYNLDDYQRPKADYSAVKNKWSLIYDLKDAGAADESTKQFIATVEEKTKTVEIRK